MKQYFYVAESTKDRTRKVSGLVEASYPQMALNYALKAGAKALYTETWNCVVIDLKVIE